MSKVSLVLERVKRTDERYQEFRNRHYVDNKGAIGRQLHYLIYVDGDLIGIISGGSAVYRTEHRDKFFGITDLNREELIQKIINNTVFRIEGRYPNLGTQVLAKWRRQVKDDWEDKYKDEVIGYETFVGGNLKGTVYKADNWTFCGKTKGYSKHHPHGAYSGSVFGKSYQKLIYCKWAINSTNAEQKLYL